MKIVILVNRFVKSGPINVVANLIKNLRDVDIYLVSLKGGISEEFKSYNLDPYCKKIFSLNASYLDLIFPRSKMKLIKDEIGDFSIVHTHNVWTDIFAYRAGLKEKQVTTIHNYLYSDYVSRYGYLIGSVLILIHTYYLKKIPSPILCSGSLVEQYRTHNFNFSFINNGIGNDYFDYPSNKSDEISKIKVEPSQIKFVSVGHLSKIKNPVMIAKVFANISSIIKNDSEITFVGEGDQEDKISSFKSANIRLVGYSNDVGYYLKQSDYYISSSITEGLPNSCLEALASGLPLVLSDIPSHRYLKSIFPESIALFDSEEELSQIVRNLLSNKLSLKVPDNHIVWENFSGNVMASNYAQQYRSLIDR